MPNSKNADTQTLTAGQSALWKYKAIYRQGDDRVGQWSNVVNSYKNIRHAMFSKKTKILKVLFVFTIFSSAFFTLQMPLFAYEYEIQGVMSYRFIDKASGSVLVDQEQEFSMAVNGCKWFLKKIPKKFIRAGKPRPMEDYTEASTDLTNFYFLVSFEGMVKTNANSLNTASGMIGNGIAPYGQDPTISLLWYAFGSGCYFQKQQANDAYIYGVASFKNPGFYSKDFRVKADWQLESVPPHLPQKIIFTGEYKFLHDNPDATFPEPLDPTNCIYTALEFTNVDGLTFPCKGIAEFPTTNSITPTFEFTVVGITSHNAREDYTVQIPGTALLSDFRPISKPLSIAVPTGPTKRWPNLDSSKGAYFKLIQNKKSLEPNSGSESAKIAKVCVLTVFCLTTGLFLTAFFWKLVQNKIK
jgi:hypothetical protein